MEREAKAQLVEIARLAVVTRAEAEAPRTVPQVRHLAVRRLDRIGLALKEENGPVKVIGYTDSEPIRTIAFPSNFQLSTARAQAASTIIGAALGEPSRITVEGRADADPIAPNSTPEGRERNRRIEVVLTRQGS